MTPKNNKDNTHRRIFTTTVEDAPVAPATLRLSEKTRAEQAVGLACLKAYRPVSDEPVEANKE